MKVLWAWDLYVIRLCWRSQRCTRFLLNNISPDTYLIKVSDSSNMSKLNNRENKQTKKQRVRLSREKADKLRGRKMPILLPRRKLTWSLGPRSAFLVTQDQLQTVTACPVSTLANTLLVLQRVAEPDIGSSPLALQAIVFPPHRCDLAFYWFLAFMPPLGRHSQSPRLKKAHWTLVYNDKTKQLQFLVFSFLPCVLSTAFSDLSQNSSKLIFLWRFVNLTWGWIYYSIWKLP